MKKHCIRVALLIMLVGFGRDVYIFAQRSRVLDVPDAGWQQSFVKELDRHTISISDLSTSIATTKTDLAVLDSKFTTFHDDSIFWLHLIAGAVTLHLLAGLLPRFTKSRSGDKPKEDKDSE